MDTNDWLPIWKVLPPINSISKPKPYVLAVDAKGRMSVGYVRQQYATGELGWIFAKPIGEPTHWMPLPDPPKAVAHG